MRGFLRRRSCQHGRLYGHANCKFGVRSCRAVRVRVAASGIMPVRVTFASDPGPAASDSESVSGARRPGRAPGVPLHCLMSLA
jgi:hypothetical protein